MQDQHFTRKFKVIWPLAVLAIIPLCVAAGKSDTIRKSFQVFEGGTLVLSSERGGIEVVTNPGNEVIVEVTRTANQLGGKDAEALIQQFEISFRQEGNNVFVEGEFTEDKWDLLRWGKNRLRVEYRVTVPQHYNVDLTTAGGNISVEDLVGNAKSRTSGGRLDFGRIDGDVSGNTSGGSIELKSATGTADLHTSGGSITVGTVDDKLEARTSGGSIHIAKAGGDVVARTSGGSVTIGAVEGSVEAGTSGGSVEARILSQPDGSCRLWTSGGNVVVYLAEGIALDVEAHASGGRIRTDLPITAKGELGPSNFQGKLNGGGPELNLRTSGGGIRILKL